MHAQVQAMPASGRWLQVPAISDEPAPKNLVLNLLTTHDRKRAMRLDYDPYLNDDKQITTEEARRRLNKFAGTAIFDRLQEEWEILSYRWSFGPGHRQDDNNLQTEDPENSGKGSNWGPDISYRVRSRYLEMVAHLPYTQVRVQAHYRGEAEAHLVQRLPESIYVFGASYQQRDNAVQFSLSRPLLSETLPGLTARMSQQQDNSQEGWYQIAEMLFQRSF